MPEIEHFFTPVSGYAYLGCAALLRLAKESGAKLRHRPVDIGRVFEAGGSTAPVRQSEARRAWRTRDMRLWAQSRGLPLNDSPRYWPTDGAPAARVIVAVERIGGPVDRCVEAVLAACWARDLDIASEATLRSLLAECGVDPDGVLNVAGEMETQTLFESNTQAAIAVGAFGSPTYIFDGEFFFGQDRLDFLRAALERETRKQIASRETA